MKGPLALGPSEIVEDETSSSRVARVGGVEPFKFGSFERRHIRGGGEEVTALYKAVYKTNGEQEILLGHSKTKIQAH